MYKVKIRIYPSHPGDDMIRFKPLTQQGLYVPKGKSKAKEKIKEEVTEFITENFKRDNPDLEFRINIVEIYRIKNDFVLAEENNKS